ncbi:uncharacterized protein N7487_010685 [Penicillium crustosum]|uniref:uncharacterized protein n=1 Tax=Penicillium crustosum TaxID=36656 RepID=UPI00239C4ED2|nr:uncharacterized protein N7487_010685 [Penicillium crustosum]KAJ5396382.1 hypothetical protein N7487_010685 [Penicillium crustosum]
MYNVSRTRTLPPVPDIVIFEEQDRLRFLDALQTARLSIVDPLSYPNVTDLAALLDMDYLTSLNVAYSNTDLCNYILRLINGWDILLRSHGTGASPIIIDYMKTCLLPEL